MPVGETNAKSGKISVTSRVSCTFGFYQACVAIANKFRNDGESRRIMFGMALVLTALWFM